MTRFKIGDRVECIGFAEGAGVQTGARGIVAGYVNATAGSRHVLVDWDNGPKNSRTRRAHLKRISPPFKAGDLIRNLSGDQDEDITPGGIYRVTSASPDGVCIRFRDDAGDHRQRLASDYEIVEDLTEAPAVPKAPERPAARLHPRIPHPQTAGTYI